jgi:hypothetical protein
MALEQSVIASSHLWSSINVAALPQNASEQFGSSLIALPNSLNDSRGWLLSKNATAVAHIRSNDIAVVTLKRYKLNPV